MFRFRSFKFTSVKIIRNANYNDTKTEELES